MCCSGRRDYPRTGVARSEHRLGKGMSINQAKRPPKRASQEAGLDVCLLNKVICMAEPSRIPLPEPLTT